LLFDGKRGDFGMVREAQNFPAPGSFYRLADRSSIRARLEIRPFPVFGLDDGSALAIAMLAESPPIAELPGNTALDLAQRCTASDPILVIQIRRRLPTGSRDGARQVEPASFRGDFRSNDRDVTAGRFL
jgi:hypothetical protein